MAGTTKGYSPAMSIQRKPERERISDLSREEIGASAPRRWQLSPCWSPEKKTLASRSLASAAADIMDRSV